MQMEFFTPLGAKRLVTEVDGMQDPYAVIPQQFGNGGMPPPQQQQQYPNFTDAPDYETYQQQQAAYRAQQAAAQAAQHAQSQQQSPSIYYQHDASYFPIHSASDHDFLGPQSVQQTTVTYQQHAPGSKEFMMQHQQRRQPPQPPQNQANPNQGQAQNQQRMGGATQSAHFMHQQHQMAQQQQQQQQQQHVAQQQMQRMPMNPQQFMVPPPAIMQPQQMANQQHIHHIQMQQMMQPPQQPPSQPSTFHQNHQNHQNQNQGAPNNAHQNPPAQHHHHHRPMTLKDWPIRCVIEGKYHPVIMGPNASTIKDITHSTHCRVEFVNLSKRERAVLGQNERILTVHGHAEQASKAVARILDVIQGEALKDDENVGADIQLRLRAHNQLCGRLIGKMGSSIKEIMQKTGTTITVAKYIDPPGGLGGLRHEEILCMMERTISVKGPSIEAVVQAESMISAKLKKCYEADTQIRAQQMTALPTLPMPPPLPPGPSGSASSVAPPSIIPTPVGLIQMQNFAPNHQNPPTAGNTFLQPGVIQVPPGTVTLRQVRLWVPDHMIGALIGAKGKNIKMIIRETGANVKIEGPEEKVRREEEEKKKAGENNADEAADEAKSKGSERLVVINGDDLQLLKAQSFIFTKIAETTSSVPPTLQDMERLWVLRIRSEVSVPTRIIGRIIGKGGQNVRELQRITGATVKIPEEERNGGEVFRHEDGLEEDLTMIRSLGNLHSTHNVQIRLSQLIGEYYRSGEHKQPRVGGARAHKEGEPEEQESPLNRMGQLGQVAPISNRNSPSSGSAKSKTP